MRLTTARRALSVVLRSMLVLLGFVGASLIALFSFEQATLRPLAEIAVERLTGRTLRIDGELDAVAGAVVTLRMGRVSLANADWGSEEPMLQIGEAQISIDLAELLGGRYLIDNLVVRDGRLLFEKSEEGRSNWALGTGGEPPEQTRGPVSPLALPVRQSQLSGIAITVIDPALTRPLDIRLERAAHEADLDRGLQANLDARINDRPLAVEARIALSGEGSAGNAVEFDLEAASETIRLLAEGNLDDPFQPRQVDLRLTLAAEEISRATGALGLPTVIVGATEIEARLAPVEGQHRLEVSGNVGELEVEARARLQSLDAIDGIAAELMAAAPDLSAVVRLPGRASVPARAFRMNSRLALSGKRLEIGETRIDLGDIHLTAEGVMSQFPNPAGANFELLFEGDNYLDVAGMLDYPAPSGIKAAPFEIRVNLEYDSREEQIFEVDLQLADLDGKLSGTVSGYPTFVGSSIDFRLTSEDALFLQQWLARPVQVEGVYVLQGRVTRIEPGFTIDEANFSLGENRLELSGRIGNQPLRRDTTLSLRYEGPDLDRLAASAGYEGFVPAGPAIIDASTTARDEGFRFDNLELRFDRSRATASGVVSRQPGYVGSHFDLAVTAEDIADLLPPGFHAYVNPGQPLELRSSLAIADQQLRIDALQARLGATSLNASGSLSMKQPLRDAAFEVSMEGPDLAAITTAELIPYSLPKEPFAIAGGIGLDDRGVALDAVEAVIGSEKLELSGSIPLDDPVEGLDLVFAASGNNIGIFVPVGLDSYEVDGRPYEAAARIALAGGVLRLQQLQFGNDRGRISGELSVSIDDPLGYGRFDLEAKGTNLQTFLPPLPRYQPAAEPFDLEARGGWSSERVEVEQGRFSIDNSQIEVRGELGLQANQGVSRFVVSASGDSLADFGQIDGHTLRPKPFHLDAALEGDAEQLSIPELRAKLGESDLFGRLAYEYGEVPNIEIALQSSLIDLSGFAYFDRSSQETAVESKPASLDGRRIPDVPVPVEYLERLNLVADIDLGELRFPRSVFHNIEFKASLQDGDLNVSRLRARGVEGELVGRFRVTAVDERIVTRGELEGIEIVLGAGEARDEGVIFPKQNYRLEFDTMGATSRELAANLNGYAQLTGAKGRLNNSYSLSLFGSFFSEFLASVNPFVTREPYTTISCFAAYAEIIDGVATINPGAVMQTDKIDIFARGQVDLGTEKIGLRFDTSARKGIGISLADFVNPFVGVGGTLAAPRLGVDPKNAMFEGGFAVATGGASIMLKSLYRRWLGSGDPCADFAAQAEKYHAERRQRQNNELQPGE